MIENLKEMEETRNKEISIWLDLIRKPEFKETVILQVLLFEDNKLHLW